LVFADAPAFAAHVFSGSFGGPCTGAGGACEPGQLEEPLKEPYGLAVNEATGEVYVIDWGNGRVDVLTSTGAFVSQFNGGAAPTGPFSWPVGYDGFGLLPVNGIAVDNSTNPLDPSKGDVYVTDTGGGVVDKFSAAGVYEGQLALGAPERLDGVAVDQNGVVWVYDRGSDNRVYIESYSDELVNKLLSGDEYQEPGVGQSPGVAVDSEGNLYVNSFGGTYFKLNNSLEAMIEGLDHETSAGAAADLSLDDIYIDNVTSVAEFNSAPACTVQNPCAKAPAEALLERFGEGHLTAGTGVAVDSATNTVYVADSATSTIDAFAGPAPPPLPATTTGEATNLQPRGGATLNGFVNPKGIPVSLCEFEYGVENGVFDHSVPCVSPHEVSESNPLTGSAEVAVSAQISGVPLHAGGLTVFYRLKAGNPNVGHGKQNTYLTPPYTPPVVGSLPVSSVTQFAATLEGTLETDEALADYHFEYGTSTAYGEVAPISDDYTPTTAETVPVSQPVSGLQAGTTYHYRLVASSPGGTEVEGSDETFTTPAIPAPTVATGGAEGVGVGSATLSGAIDPHGWDTNYLFEYGTSTAYGQSWPTVQVEMGALEGSQPVAVNVPNLLPSTTYYYRLVASNGGGTTYGPDMTFTTGEYPAQAIREPVALRTLLVPSEPGKIVTSEPKKSKKKIKRAKVRRRAKHAGLGRRRGGRK
jgi:DNA-binding beta-propeller fold protein YncE